MMNQSIEANQRGSFNSTIQNSDVFHDIFDSPLGPIKISANETSLKKVEFLFKESPSNKAPKNYHLLEEARKQILAYLNGKLKTFDLPYDFSEGTDFQREVWEVLAQIPFGELLSYGQVAAKVGRPKAARAIGGAANKNPLPLIIPCHRVLGSTGLLVGFAPGLVLKKDLLALEGHQVNGNSVA